MNETDQVREDTKALPVLKDIQVPPQAVDAQPITEEPEGLNGSTIRLDRLPHLTASFVAAQEAAMDREMPTLAEKRAPADDYIPPEKVIEHPRSRMHSIKRKIIEGPEKRYYELTGKGAGRHQIRMILALVLVAVSAAAAAGYAGGFVGADRLKLMVFGQVLIMLLAALIGNEQLLDGLGDLFARGRFTLNTLLAVTFAACCCDAVYCLQEERVPICAAFALEVAMALWADHQRHTTELGQMDTLRKAIRLDGLYRVQDFYNGRDGIVRDVGELESFMDHYKKPPRAQKRQDRYALASLVVSLGISIAAGILHGSPMALLILSTTLLVSVPASFFA